MMRKILTIIALVCVAISALAADSKTSMFNPIHTAMVSNNIAPDARAGGMGDVGAATTLTWLHNIGTQLNILSVYLELVFS